jgi:hypothetical protein
VTQIDRYRRSGAKPVLMHPADLAERGSSAKVRKAFQKLEGSGEPAVDRFGSLELLIAQGSGDAVEGPASDAKLHPGVGPHVP